MSLSRLAGDIKFVGCPPDQVGLGGEDHVPREVARDMVCPSRGCEGHSMGRIPVAVYERVGPTNTTPIESQSATVPVNEMHCDRPL